MEAALLSVVATVLTALFVALYRIGTIVGRVDSTLAELVSDQTAFSRVQADHGTRITRLETRVFPPR